LLDAALERFSREGWGGTSIRDLARDAGVPRTERDDSWSLVLPDRVLVFQGPLERWCTSEEELREEIAVTVLHEVAHHFGISDARLHELGWA